MLDTLASPLVWSYIFHVLVEEVETARDGFESGASVDDPLDYTPIKTPRVANESNCSVRTRRYKIQKLFTSTYLK